MTESTNTLLGGVVTRTLNIEELLLARARIEAEIASRVWSGVQVIFIGHPP